MRLTRERPIARTIEERAVSAAISWHVRLNGGNAGESEAAAFRTWLSADPYHPIAARLVGDSWGMAGQLDIPPSTPVASRHGKFRSLPVGIGATAVAAMLVTGVLLLPGKTDHYATGIGESRSIALADGSHVSLNADSRIDVRYGWLSRDLILSRGDAEFRVAHDSWRPFTVSAAHVAVRAVGTRFAVSERRQETVVALSEGMVELRDRSGDVQRTLVAGSKAVATGNATIRQLGKLDPVQDLGWQRGLIVLDDITLAEAADRFARYSPVTVAFDEPSLGRIRVSGMYRTRDLDSFLNAVGRIYGLHVTSPTPAIRKLSRIEP